MGKVIREWASLMAQMIKNLPAMQETQVQSLGGEDPWRKKWLPTLIFLPEEAHGQRRLGWGTVTRITESDTTEQLTQFTWE